MYGVAKIALQKSWINKYTHNIFQSIYLTYHYISMDDMLRYFDDISMELYNELKAMFDNRPLYILFETILGCNPKDDHKTPKNVFPIFHRQ